MTTVPVSLLVRAEGEKGGSAQFGPAPRLLRTDCLPCTGQPKEDSWIPSPPVQKT